MRGTTRHFRILQHGAKMYKQHCCIANEDDISFAVVFAFIVPEINFADVAEVHLFPGSEVPIY